MGDVAGIPMAHEDHQVFSGRVRGRREEPAVEAGAVLCIKGHVVERPAELVPRGVERPARMEDLVVLEPAQHSTQCGECEPNQQEASHPFSACLHAKTSRHTMTEAMTPTASAVSPASKA